MSPGTQHFVCTLCGERFKGRLFALNRSARRLVFGDGHSAAHVEGAIAIATYCSEGCQEFGVPCGMEEEQVPIPAHPPGPGPIEVCAVCQGPVDMSQWHLDYSVSVEEERGPSILQVIGDHSIAVVCGHCTAARGSAQAAEEVSEPLRIE